MQVKVKKLVPHAILPKYAKSGDAGLDLYAIDCGYDPENDYIEYGTGLAFEIPEGYVGLIFPRSSISKTPLMLCNAVGVLDSSYRGEVSLRFKRLNEDREHFEYQIGDRVGQLIIIPYPQVELVESDSLSETSRGSGSFGSSGR